MANIQDHPTSLLLVEGNDDFHVVHSICSQFQIPVRNRENPKGGAFSIVDCKGINELFEQIPIRFKSSQLISTIGIIIDADIELQFRWQTVQDILTRIGFNVPPQIPPEGLILNEGLLRIGVWIMPNNNLNGMLEDFITFLIPENDKLLPIVCSTLDNIESQGLNKYSLIHRSKSKIHSWLALQEEPGSPLGLSITKRFLSLDGKQCLLFRNWLEVLFSN